MKHKVYDPDEKLLKSKDAILQHPSKRGGTMKYIVDIEALKGCLELTPQCSVNGEPYLSLEIVCEMIDRFPKEEYRESANYATRGSVNEDIQDGIGLKPLRGEE